MFVSQILLNPMNREVRRDLSDRHDLHQTVMSGFPAIESDEERVLFRLEIGRSGQITLLVQSQDEPRWERSETLGKPGVLLVNGKPNPWVKSVDPSFEAGREYRFRLDANPTVKREGHRHALLKEAEQEAWLVRKGEQHGFHVLTVQTGSESDARGIKQDEDGKELKLKWHGVRFDGVLRVTDAALFAQAVACGIGSAKAFGFGLLSIAPIRG